MKSEYIERRYKMNKETAVIVKSKKKNDADIYENTLTVVQHSLSMEPLKIGTRAEIEAAVAELDLVDDQTSLFAGEAG